MEALAAGLPFMTCRGGVPGDLPVVGVSDSTSPLVVVVFLRLKRPIGTRGELAHERGGCRYYLVQGRELSVSRLQADRVSTAAVRRAATAVAMQQQLCVGGGRGERRRREG